MAIYSKVYGIGFCCRNNAAIEKRRVICGIPELLVKTVACDGSSLSKTELSLFAEFTIYITGTSCSAREVQICSYYH